MPVSSAQAQVSAPSQAPRMRDPASGVLGAQSREPCTSHAAELKQRRTQVCRVFHDPGHRHSPCSPFGTIRIDTLNNYHHYPKKKTRFYHKNLFRLNFSKVTRTLLRMAFLHDYCKNTLCVYFYFFVCEEEMENQKTHWIDWKEIYFSMALKSLIKFHQCNKFLGLKK